MPTTKEIRDAADHRLYKELSTPEQRSEACRKAEAIYTNSMNDLDLPRDPAGTHETFKFKLLVNIERTLLDLIIQRDSNDQR